MQGYGIGDHAPGVQEIATGVYEAAHNLIRAHAKAYRAYEKDFKPTQGGEEHFQFSIVQPSQTAECPTSISNLLLPFSVFVDDSSIPISAPT